mgnify:CR=1 FL=1
MKNLILLLVLGCSAPLFAAQEPVDPLKAYRERQEQATPASVLAWLKEGNERFAAGSSHHGGYPADMRERRSISAKGQRPLAAVLSCIDSRTTPDTVFDTAVGDLFVARVGANVINDDIVGSLEVAAASGAKVIVVMGHTNCGGVIAACNNLEFGHFTQLLQKVRPAISTANDALDRNPELSRKIGERVASNGRYIGHVSHANARQSTIQLQAKSAVLRDMIAKGEIAVITALYDVDTGKVSFEEPAR